MINAPSIPVSGFPEMFNSLKLMPRTDILTSTLKEKIHFSFVKTEKPEDYRLVSLNDNMMKELKLNPESNQDRDELVKILAGKVDLDKTWSLCYGGHQFQQWAGQLGDGRVISLGQYKVDNKIYELQLKGAGRTPYSRFGDGLAVLRSSIREYLCAEAMHALGIPSSRSLALVQTSTKVQRETVEPGAIVTRVASSWLRLGSFEILYARSEFDNMKLLADYTIDNFFPHIKGETKYSDFATDVIVRTGKMIAKWQAAGFCHGVMNTDNFSVLGITIDYGPFQFLDHYDPFYVCNHSDETGLYAFMEQPKAAYWNLIRFVSVLIPLFKLEGGAIELKARNALEQYTNVLQDTYTAEMCAKLGFLPNLEVVKAVVEPLLQFMDDAQLDYSRFFYELSNASMDPESDPSTVENSIKCSYMSLNDWNKTNEQGISLKSRFLEWLAIYRQETIARGVATTRKDTMLKKNPRYILRNHLAQQVITQAENGDYAGVESYLRLLQDPFTVGSVEDQQKFGGLVPTNERGLKCSCSS